MGGWKAKKVRYKRGSLRSDSISRLMRTDIVESVKKTCGAKKKATKTTTKKVVHSHNTKSGKKENQLLKSKKKKKASL